MNRRDALLKIYDFLANNPPSVRIKGRRYHTGWIDLPSIQPQPRISTRFIAGTGRGKIVLLHKAFEHIVGRLIPHNQFIGDCVSQAYGLGVDILTATQIASGSRERWIAKSSTEAIYGGARVQIAKNILRGDGAMGAWAAKWLRTYGNVLRKDYHLSGDVYDLRNYSGSRARKYGRNGLPTKLEPIAKKHPVRTTALIQTWSELCDAIANGYPVPVCSYQGFNSTRDKDGFLRPEGKWAHAMLILGIDDTRRPGALIQNSWGSNWVSGPTRFGQPGGSFWVDAEIIEKMLSQEDSFALSNYIGFPRRKLPNYVLY